MDLMSRVLSPYDLNPLGLNPLRSIIAASIDFNRLARSPIKLFITATNVRTGRGHIFRNAEITADVLLASACLPTMFRAIEIDGESYWDGGYAGNPTITPLVRESDAHDTILVQINPRERPDTPRSAGDILNRLNEISFNSPLMKELRMIALLHQVADPGTGEGARWAQMRTHRIMTDALAQFGASSKLNAEWDFIAMLKAEGRRAASEFLEHTPTTSASAPQPIWICFWRSAERGPRRHPRWPWPSDLARFPRLERAAAGAGRRVGRCSLRLANRCSPAGRRFSWAVPPAFWRSSSRCFFLAPCSASLWTTAVRYRPSPIT